jgi:hypothetical protein
MRIAAIAKGDFVVLGVAGRRHLRREPTQTEKLKIQLFGRTTGVAKVDCLLLPSAPPVGETHSELPSPEEAPSPSKSKRIEWFVLWACISKTDAFQRRAGPGRKMDVPFAFPVLTALAMGVFH